MLISSDLLHHLAKRFVEPPAELCLIRVIGSDHEFVFRVRYGDVHLDYPFAVPLFDSAAKVYEACNWDELGKCLAVMSEMVVPPGAREKIGQRYSNWGCGGSLGRSYSQPQILAPMSSDEFHFWTP